MQKTFIFNFYEAAEKAVDNAAKRREMNQTAYGMNGWNKGNERRTKVNCFLEKCKTVQGFIFFKDKMGELPITLRVTRDAMGQSISLADDNGGLMLEIPVEPVKDLIEVKP